MDDGNGWVRVRQRGTEKRELSDEGVNFPLLEGSGISWMTICTGCCRVDFYPV